MYKPYRQLEILGYLIKQRNEGGATQGEIAEALNLASNTTGAWLYRLTSLGLVEATGQKGAYRYWVKQECLNCIDYALATSEEVLDFDWKWLGLAALLVMLNREQSEC